MITSFLFELSLRFQHVTPCNRNAVERLLKTFKRCTEKFAAYFRYTTAGSPKQGFKPSPTSEVR
jgi:hypothetical protein